MVTQTITINLTQSRLAPIIMRSEEKGREIQFEVIDEAGEPEDLTGYSLKYMQLKPDGNVVYADLASGILTQTEQMVTSKGKGYYCIRIMDDDTIIYSGQGPVVIDDHVIDDETLESISEVDGLVFPDDFYTRDDNVAVIDDNLTTTDKTWSSSKISSEIASPDYTETASGNPIILTVAADAPIVKCVTDITGYQQGSGTPSPDNIRPIVAYTEGEIEVSDGDGNTTTHTTTFPYAIYRGSEDVVKGEVTSEMLVVDLGDFTWALSGTVWYTSINGLKRPEQTGYKLNALCSSYEIVAQTMAPQATHVCISGLNWLDGIALWKSDYETAQDVKTAMTGVKLAYELVTPTTSSVTPTNLPIKSLNGYTHIESRTGDMEVEYIKSSAQSLVDLIEAVTR